jgi:hypothetical protein
VLLIYLVISLTYREKREINISHLNQICYFIRRTTSSLFSVLKKEHRVVSPPWCPFMWVNAHFDLFKNNTVSSRKFVWKGRKKWQNKIIKAIRNLKSTKRFELLSTPAWYYFQFSEDSVIMNARFKLKPTRLFSITLNNNMEALRAFPLAFG